MNACGVMHVYPARAGCLCWPDDKGLPAVAHRVPSAAKLSEDDSLLMACSSGPSPAASDIMSLLALLLDAPDWGGSVT